MIFSSHIFLFVFLPLFIAAYYAAPVNWRSAVIVVGSWGFYAWWRIDFLALYAVVTVWSYLFGRLIASASTPEAAYRWCATGVIGSLLVLVYFKYFNFLADSLLALTADGAKSQDVFWTVILPIGVSFFVFESISYLVDIYRKDAEPADNFMDFAAFLALYPHLIAGPVMRYKDLNAQIRQRTHNWRKFSEGAGMLMLGLSKKVLIADSVAPIADIMFGQASPSLTEAWLGAIAYTIQLYFDFSGYSDMAIGLGLMMGFRLINNFNHPYISTSITDFWHRWHISLSTWLRDYLYIALGGNRNGTIRTYLNLMLTMVLGGLWHGANWTFVLWGTWHGMLLAIERLITKGKGRPYPRLIAWPLTMLFVIVGWVMFRAPTVSSAFAFYRGMIGLNDVALSADVAWRLKTLDLLVLAAGIAIVVIAPRISVRDWARRFPQLGHVRLVDIGATALVAVSVISVFKLAADSYSPFLYFQF